MDVLRIEECDEHVDVEQVGHGRVSAYLRLIQKSRDIVGRNHTSTGGGGEERYAVALGLFVALARHGGAGQIGEHLSQCLPRQRGEFLYRTQHVIVEIDRRSHASNIMHHASRHKFGPWS